MYFSKVEKESAELEAWVKTNRDAALGRYKEIFDENASVHVMHAHIGRNNNTFVDSVRTQFTGPDDFLAQWLFGLKKKILEISATNTGKYGAEIRSEQIIRAMLFDKILREYTLNFLRRNFYRNFFARIRAKPGEDLWSLWFGKDLCWGLVISPAYRREGWTNDKSQMRREKYTYWTLGHVLETGLIDPQSDEPIRFSSLKQFLAFYQSILKRLSVSKYEQAIFDRYADYISKSTAPLDEPLLIPEFRYAGKDERHLYRVDFTVFNGHTSDLTGFELSPASTHLHVRGVSGKSQREINDELTSAWERETHKRNAYFEKYGITIVTFVDRDLTDADACFSRIRRYLEQRNRQQSSIEEQLAALEMA
jgi:hypothetical protein